MNRYKKLFSNSIIFAIGNLGSKMITFLMVPLYTRYLSTAQYGQADVLTTFVELLTPVITLSVIDAVFRFSLEKSQDKSEVLTNGMVVTFASVAIYLPFIILTNKFHYATYVILLTYVTALESMLQQFARGIEQSATYAATGIVMTVTTVVSNIILIVFAGHGLQGYLTSMVLAQIAGIVFLTISLHLWKYINLRFINKHLISKMLIYSVPLIPNVVSWWLSNSANKVIISILLGVSANGIYAVANKIPSLISVFYTIFTQAWQISAVEEFHNEDSPRFFSQVFSITVRVLFVGVAILVFLAKPMVLVLSTHAYFEAWRVVPWLSLAVLYSSASSFLGTVYTASMQTGKLFTTTIIGAVINVGANFVLIPMFGVTGAGVGACLSFLTVTLMRLQSSRKFIRITIDRPTIFVNHLLVIIEMLFLYLISGWISVLLTGAITIIVVVINSRPLIGVLKSKKSH